MLESDAALGAFLIALRRRGVREPRLIAAIETTPREVFLLPAHTAWAYAPLDLPLEAGRTARDPAVVATLLQAAEPQPAEDVMVVSAGCGYPEALLARLARCVVAYERSARRIRAIRRALSSLGIEAAVGGVDSYPPSGSSPNVVLTHGDPLGAGTERQVDLLISLVAIPPPRAPWLRFLRTGGRALLPVADGDSTILIRLTAHREERLGTLAPVGWCPQRPGRLRHL